MTFSAAEKLNEMVVQATDIWVPNWFKKFSDNVNGGFHERLSIEGQSLNLPKRLHGQCRQIIVYSLASMEPGGEKYLPKLQDGFEFLISNFRNPENNGSFASVTPEGAPKDKSYPLYGLAFVLLACAAYSNALKAKGMYDARVLNYAEDTLGFIKENFPVPGQPGLYNALDENLKPVPGDREQNPHMHLLEGSLYMAEAVEHSWEKQLYVDFARQMVGVFYANLLDEKTGTLGEFFTNDLKPVAGDKGLHVEAGHQSEWVWLLHRYAQVTHTSDQRIPGTMANFFNWVSSKGLDPEYGGIFNAQRRDGSPINTDKRIWPNLETMRAASIMLHVPGYEAKAEGMLQKLTELFQTKYINRDGNWNEMLTRDLTPHKDFIFYPSTTPYHIYPVLREARKYALGQ